MAHDHETYSQADLAAINMLLPKIFREDAEVLSDYTQYGIWLARELDYVKAKTYEKLLPAINADMLVPDSLDVPEWAETVTIRAFNNVGMAKIISNYADDLPRADIAGAIKTVPVRTIGDSYGYNVNELRASRATGVGLDTKKADAARKAVDLKLANIKLRGDADYGLYGLFTMPGLPQVVTWNNPGNWATMSGDNIYANLVQMWSMYEMQTLGVHVANFLAMAPAAYQRASSVFVTTAPGLPITPIELFARMHPGLRIVPVWELTGAMSGRDVIFMYENNSDNLAHELVMPFTQLPPEARNLEIVTDCLARSAGVQVYYPLAFLWGYTSV